MFVEHLLCGGILLAPVVQFLSISHVIQLYLHCAMPAKIKVQNHQIVLSLRFYKFST